MAILSQNRPKMSNFQNLLEAISQSPTPVWAGSREYSRNDFLISAGEVEKNIYFVKSGAVRVIYQTEFEEHTIRFGYKGSIINSIRSFYRQEPSEYYIQALKKTAVQYIPRETFMEFIGQSAEHLSVYRQMLEELVLQQMEREIDLLTYSPQERYARVLARSPQLFQEIPSKYIASYLRMTPETLSRLRNS